ncbi:MAG TPA: NAD(P)H-binding protein [Ktedonobacteraceae bacterium]|nr:NAD(P)H-binding protein [Ktedonobacteraceae bacterium]
MTTVLVTGATGTLGREVVARLIARQHRTRILSHQSAPSLPEDVEVITGDLVSGSGLREAVAGVSAIIHCASAPRDANQVDVEGTRSLLQAAHGSRAHIIYPSIVGVDRSTYAYYQAKRATEVVIEQGPLPWTIVRATQFHNLVLRLIQTFGADTLPVVAVAGGMRFQSIDVGEVADHLITLMEQGPAEHTPDIGGPQVRTIEEMSEAYLRIRGRKATIQSAALAGDVFDVFRSGINLVPDHAVGTITWEAFLHRLYDH